jgi:basic amino acid/polyamine antiporter, APA family
MPPGSYSDVKPAGGTPITELPSSSMSADLDSPAGHPSTSHNLQRQLGLGAAAAAVAGEAIGVGIFLTPAGMARQLGSPFWLLMVWLVMGLMAVAGALCFGGLAARYPEAGGGYVYLREAYGPRLAFLYGWMQLLVLDPGVTASLAVGMAAYTAAVTHLSPGEQKVLGIGVILGLALLNIRGARLGAGLLQALTWLKIAALGLLPVWALALRLGDWSHFTPFIAQRPGSASLFAAFAGSSMAAFYSFGGWWDAAKIAGEVPNPERTMPRALTLGVVAVTLVYILVTGVFVYLVPFQRITSDETFMAEAGQRLFGPAGGDILAALVVLCVLGSMAALLMLSPRVYYAMARDGLFFQAAAEIHLRYGTPARAIAVQAILASLLVALGTFSQIVAYFVFVAVVFLGLTVAGVIRLHNNLGDGTRLFVPGYPYTPLAFLALVSVLLVLLAGHNPLQATLGVVVVIMGFPAFRLVRR